MHFVEKKKYFKKTEAKQKGNTLVPTYPNGGFYSFIFQEQYKVLISKPVADKKKEEDKKKRQSERRLGA